jgi:hypothetical protein
MANTVIPVEERKLTPGDIAVLDRRRRRGQLFLVIGVQCLIVSLLMLLWSGQDATYSPGLARPMVIWNAITAILAAFFLLTGISLRRGSNEFFSY